MAPRPTCGSLLSLGVEGGVYGGCWSPLTPLRPAAVLLGSWFQMWAACVSLPREAHVTGRWLSPESGRGTLLQAQGRLGDKPPAGLGSITPAMGAGSCIWRGECRLGFSTAQVSVDFGGQGRWPASPELRRSLGAILRRAAGRLGGHLGSSTLSCLGHLLATDMCCRNGGPSWLGL